MRERRDRAWWTNAIRRWRRSGFSAAEFARSENLSDNTLRWWAYELRRREQHADVAPEKLVPLEVVTTSDASTSARAVVEITLGDVQLAVAIGADVDYVAALIGRLERGRFRMPRIEPGTRTAVLDSTELTMLLDGIDLGRVARPRLWAPPAATASGR